MKIKDEETFDAPSFSGWPVANRNTNGHDGMNAPCARGAFCVFGASFRLFGSPAGCPRRLACILSLRGQEEIIAGRDNTVRD